MTAAIDTSLLLLLLDPKTPTPNDGAGKPVSDAQQRVLHLLSELSKAKRKLIIPTPVLSEMLLLTQTAGQAYLEKINKSRAFIVAPFDQKAAIELALMTAVSKRQARKLRAGSAVTAAKLKFDRQIVAIAKVNGATTIYASDSDLATFATNNGLEAIKLEELELPEKDRQMDFLAWPDKDESDEAPEPPAELPDTPPPE